MDATQWTQGGGLVKQMEDISSSPCTNRASQEKKPRPQEQLTCPRCNSRNTKFCYYNNYSLSQPRYFCKGCRRYWTEGGTLRNVPVGGGSRKNKRVSSSSSAVSSKNLDLNPGSFQHFSAQNTKNHAGQDLNLGFPVSQGYEHGVSHILQVSKAENVHSNQHNMPSSSATSNSTHQLSALELLRTGIVSRPFSSFIAPMPYSNTIYSTSSPLQEIKPNVSFPVDSGHEIRYGNLHGIQGNGGRILFPFGEPKQLSSTSEVVENKGQGSSNEYWSGIFNGRSW